MRRGLRLLCKGRWSMADEDLFGEDYLFFYAEDASEASVKRDADTILRMLDLAPGSSILEVGCGEGRLLRELAACGYRGAASIAARP